MILWIPGLSKPPPNHFGRCSVSHRLRTSVQLRPWSALRNRPPGMVPHHRVAAVSAKAQRVSTLASTSSGKAGVARSSQVAPRSVLTWSLGP